jgi:hypothetical protein
MFGIAVFLLAVLFAPPQNLSGIWTGNIEQKGYDGKLEYHGPAYIELQQTEQKITGAVGPDAGHSHSIENASFAAGRLRFETHYKDGDETVTWTFTLNVNGNSMEGTATGARGSDSWTMDIKVSRREMALRRPPLQPVRVTSPSLPPR